MHVIAMNAMPPKGDPISRRNFLDLVVKTSLAGSALLGMGMLVRYISFQSEASPPTHYDLGLASDYPLGELASLSNMCRRPLSIIVKDFMPLAWSVRTLAVLLNRPVKDLHALATGHGSFQMVAFGMDQLQKPLGYLACQTKR